jgi:hypothetical protein
MIQYAKDCVPVIQEFSPEFAGFFMTGSRHLFTQRLQTIQFVLKLSFGAPSKAWCFLPGASPGREGDQEDLS